MDAVNKIWSYEVLTQRGMITKEIKDDDGNPVFDKRGEQAKTKFRVKRVYLVLTNLKYNKTVTYNVSKANGTKLIPFFTHRGTKQQILASLMGEHLRDRFGTQAFMIVKEAIDHL